MRTRIAGSVWLRTDHGTRPAGPAPGRGFGNASFLADRRAVVVDANLAIVADARIDNRDELTERLQPARRDSAAALILAAFRQWGEDCCRYLLGDFAFAIADNEADSLFLARDQFGVRPLYYCHGAERFDFASSIGDLLGEGIGTAAVRDTAVAAFLAGSVLDHDRTLYSDVFRLPAAHTLTVRNRTLAIRRYWSPSPVALPSGRDLPSLFRETFERAVGDRIDDATHPAALLSGGLDSSSIACVARDRLAVSGRPLRTFSLVLDDPLTVNEAPFIDAVAKQGGIDSAIFGREDFAPLADLDAVLDEQGGPVLAPNLSLIRWLMQRAREAGVEVLLDGHGGDEVVSHGYGRLDELAAAGRWRTLWKESAACAGNYGRDRRNVFIAVCRRHRSASARIMSRVNDMIARGSPAAGRLHFLAPGRAKDPEFNQACAAAMRVDPGCSERHNHIATLRHPLQPLAFEVLANLYDACGIEGRFPFWDRRLVELCISLPAEEKLDGGWSRLILRRAMGDILPEQVRWRRDKTNFVHMLGTGLVRHHSQQIEDLLADRNAALADFIDRGAARASFNRLRLDPKLVSGREIQALWRVAVAGRWLERRRSAVARETKPDQVAHQQELQR